ncbi:MAG: flagellar biosynthesis anti-sigma factor FlgM [Deltaproteobacteria bacterium]|nr:flagellar biosynthesis anti-sigma factor FlgM [Deltaproteobacteria bacterium]
MRVPPNGTTPLTRETESRQPAKPDGSSAAQAADAPPVVVAPQTAAAGSTQRKSEAESEAKVAAVKALLDAGTYRVDLDRLAERLVDEELARAERAR